MIQKSMETIDNRSEHSLRYVEPPYGEHTEGCRRLLPNTTAEAVKSTADKELTIAENALVDKLDSTSRGDQSSHQMEMKLQCSGKHLTIAKANRSIFLLCLRGNVLPYIYTHIILDIE